MRRGVESSFNAGILGTQISIDAVYSPIERVYALTLNLLKARWYNFKPPRPQVESRFCH